MIDGEGQFGIKHTTILDIDLGELHLQLLLSFIRFPKWLKKLP
jgi:hypothetical protein